jgi:hypothetical protein
MQPLAASQQGNGDVALIAQVLTAPDSAAGRKILEEHLRKQISARRAVDGVRHLAPT